MYKNKKQKHETVSYKMYETENRIRKTVFCKTRETKSTNSFCKTLFVKCEKFVKRVKKKQKRKSFYKTHETKGTNSFYKTHEIKST